MLSGGHNQAICERSSLRSNLNVRDDNGLHDELGVNRGKRHESRRRTLYQIYLELQNRAEDSCCLLQSQIVT